MRDQHCYESPPYTYECVTADYYCLDWGFLGDFLLSRVEKLFALPRVEPTASDLTKEGANDHSAMLTPLKGEL